MCEPYATFSEALVEVVLINFTCAKTSLPIKVILPSAAIVVPSDDVGAVPSNQNLTAAVAHCMCATVASDGTLAKPTAEAATANFSYPNIAIIYSLSNRGRN